MSRVPRRAVSRLPLLLAMLLGCAGRDAHADAGWFESGDTQLRLDLQVLNDAGIIRLPISQWPLPRAAVRYALANPKSHVTPNAGVAAALDRVRARVGVGEGGELQPTAGTQLNAAMFGGQQALWRDFDTPAREEVELHAGGAYDSEHFSIGIQLTGVNDPEDGQEVRLDGSHATVQLGNWLLSANALDRWWGPGHEGSLILSSNARPMPTLTVERASAMPFETKWLSWLGPWRMSFGVSQMESSREDIDSPLFMAWRAVIMPFKDIELGFSRTAQFCGEQLECNLNVFGNLLAGNDNVGIDATPENEPGNQMAGFDIRWGSPIGNLPYAIYSQYIGEDESSYVPAKYLGQLGLEVWHPYVNGGMLQMFGEYANTTCSGMSSRGPYYDCAYRQGRFNVEGYRYRGRVIGHSTDADSESYSLGAIYTATGGSLWTATARAARLNHDGIDPYNTVSPSPTRYAALELSWRGLLLGESMSVEVGAESIEPEGGERDVDPFGFIGWRHEFRP